MIPNGILLYAQSDAEPSCLQRVFTQKLVETNVKIHSQTLAEAVGILRNCRGRTVEHREGKDTQAESNNQGSQGLTETKQTT